MKDGETKEEYRKLFLEDTICAHLLLKKITGMSPLVYTYPFGSICNESKSVLQCMGYRFALGCAEGFNTISPYNKEFVILKRFNRTPEKSVKDIFEY